MVLLDTLKQDLLVAVKARDALRASTLRMLLAAFNNKEIEKKTLAVKANKDFAPLTEEEMVQVIQKEVKQRKESALGYRVGKREDLANQEEAEAGILAAYLPAQLTGPELKIKVVEMIKELGAQDSSAAGLPAQAGKLIGRLSQELKGKADLSEVAQVVRELLQG